MKDILLEWNPEKKKLRIQRVVKFDNNILGSKQFEATIPKTSSKLAVLEWRQQEVISCNNVFDIQTIRYKF